MAPLAFAGSPLDRADHLRADPDRLAGLRDWRARLLLLDGLDPRLDTHGAITWGSLAEVADDDELVFLGLDPDGRACFAPVAAQLAGSTGPATARLWPALSAMASGDLATYGGARSLVDWHARHRFCARCGGPTHLAKGGWQRSCGSCRADHFPRVDPVTIMLVEHDDRLLLGRQPRFPAGNYSALAGFVEPGESLEEAVAREVFEEAGVRVRDVTYIASQPWPFPSNLMIGCLAHADNPQVTVDRTELEDACWFSRDDVRDAVAAAEQGERGAVFTAPQRFAIANHLMRWWLAEG